MAPKWTPLEPVEKLSLAVRKNVRDNFEAHRVEHEEALAGYFGVEKFTITVDVNKVFAYTESSGYGKDNIGYLINEYYSSLVNAVRDYTNQGKDEEAKEVLRKVVPKHSSTIDATDKVSYCGLDIVDGELRVVFNYKYLGSNISSVGEKIASVVDQALDALGENELPIVARRSIQKNITEKLPEWQELTQELFGKEYKFEFDVRAALDKLSQFPDDISWFKDRINEAVPSFIGGYFEAVLRNLKDLNFGKDDMLQEAFLDATGSQIIRFEVVDKLAKGKSYNDAVFVDGELRLQAAPKNFASNISDIGRDLVDKL